MIDPFNVLCKSKTIVGRLGFLDPSVSKIQDRRVYYQFVPRDIKGLALVITKEKILMNTSLVGLTPLDSPTPTPLAHPLAYPLVHSLVRSLALLASFPNATS